MRRVFLGFLCFMVLASVAWTAEEGEVAPAVRQGFSLGFQGLGGVYGEAQPTLRWRFADHLALDLIPAFEFLDSDEDQYPYTRDTYGLDLALTGRLKTYDQLELGLTGLAGFRQSDDESGNDFDFWRIGVGLDLEYFLKAVPGLSLGAQLMVVYSEQENLMSYVGGARDFTIDRLSLRGQVLTVRYYF